VKESGEFHVEKGREEVSTSSKRFGVEDGKDYSEKIHRSN